MLGKKRIIILVSLGVFSFAVAFVVSAWVASSSPPQQAQAQQAETSEPQNALVRDLRDSGLVELKPREEELRELIKEVRHKIAVYRDKEHQLQEREKRIGMTEELLVKQTKELANLRVQLVAAMTALNDAQAEAEKNKIVMEAQELTNLSKIAAGYEKMDPAAAAEIMTQMCNNQQHEDVVRILYLMSEKRMSALVAEMKDRQLAATLIQQMKHVKQ